MSSEVLISEKFSYQAISFYNRLLKNFRKLKKWARKNGITCFRLYDRDIPDVPLCLDVYTFLPPEVHCKSDAKNYIEKYNKAISENGASSISMIETSLERTFVCLYLYEKSSEKTSQVSSQKDLSEEDTWLNLMKEKASLALQIPESNVIIKTRRKQKADLNGKKSQYEKKEAEHCIEGLVFEQGQIFFVNLTDRIDTGLFFDHRPLRKKVREESKGKRVLNLFCYTGSFSVYAAEGGASLVESIDLSHTYLEWTNKNLFLNGFKDNSIYRTIRDDAPSFLSRRALKAKEDEKFDIIILDPPTFSNSKGTKEDLDLNLDWQNLVKDSLSLLSPNGVLYFSTNSRKLKLDKSLLPEGSSAEEITESTIPEDYRNSRIHRAWAITKD